MNQWLKADLIRAAATAALVGVGAAASSLILGVGMVAYNWLTSRTEAQEALRLVVLEPEAGKVLKLQRPEAEEKTDLV